MRRLSLWKELIALLLLSAAVAASVGSSRRAPSPPLPIDAATSTWDVQSASSAPTTLRVGGTIEKYDASTRMLSLITATGTVQFALAASVRIRRRGRQIDASALEHLSGYRAVVRYSEAHGNKTVESISVLEQPKG
jgi:hypothetical protein